MPDKNAEFLRINLPRAERATKQIELIAASARSMKVDPTEVLDHVGEALRAESPKQPQPTPEPAKAPTAPVTSPVARRLPIVQHLSTTELIDWALAAAVEIAARRS